MRKILAAFAALFSLTTVALADNVLVLGGEGDSHVSVKTELEAKGHTVTYQAGTGSPGDLAGYQQVWDMRYGTALSADDMTKYDAFLKNRGYLYLSGEHAGFATRNNSISAFTSSLGGGTITVGGSPQNNQTGNGTYFPNGETVDFAAAATITSAGGRVLSADGSGNATAKMWIGNAGDLGATYNGTVVVVADINWTQSAFYDANNEAFLEQLINGIVAGTVGGTISNSGNGAAGGGTPPPAVTITGADGSVTRVVTTAAGTPVVTTQTTIGTTTRSTAVTYGTPVSSSVNSDVAARDSKNVNITRTVTTTTVTPVTTTHTDTTPVTTVTTTTTPTVTTVTTTPVTTITKSDGTTETVNGTPVVNTYTSYTAVNQTTVANVVETTAVNSSTTAVASTNSTKSASILGTKDAIASRNMNLFAVDALGTKDGVWASPTARYTQTVGNYRIGGISGGYQTTVDNNSFGFAAYYEMGESKDFLNSSTDQKSYGALVYALTKQDYAWFRVAIGASQSEYKNRTSIPEFALINSSRVKQNNFYADIAAYTPETYVGFRPVVGVIVNDSMIASASEYGSLLLSTIPNADSTIKAMPYAGTRFEIDEDVAAEFRVIQTPDFKTVGSVRGSVKKEIYDGIFIDLSAGFDKGFSVDYNNAVGKAGLKVKF